MSYSETVVQEFSNSKEILQFLQMKNPHIAEIMSRYRALNKMIHRIEAGIETASDFRLTELKKRRLVLNDEIEQLIVHER